MRSGRNAGIFVPSHSHGTSMTFIAEIVRPSMRADWLRATTATMLCAMALALSGCGILPPKVLTTPDNPVPVAKYFPSALLAEPLQMRAGYVHETQPFAIKGPEERWSVALGFVRTDAGLTPQQRLDGQSNTCWIDSPGYAMKSCTQPTPGFHVRWDLLRSDGSIAASAERDSLVQRGGGTSAAIALTSTLSGFTRQSAGIYRLRVTVLREAEALAFLKPHILVDRPFFRHVW